MRLSRPLLSAAAALSLASCGGAAPAHSASIRSQAAPVTGPVAAAPATHPTKVLVVVEENHTQSSALAGMPYLSSLANSYGRTSAYRAVTHPSLPNYLAIAGGSTFNVHDDQSPASHRITGPSVFDRVIAHGHTAKTYADAMPTACGQSPSGRYAVKHNPWAYFADPGSRANCRRFDVPTGTTSSGPLRRDIDAGTLPNVGLLIPDLCHDGHDCSLATADNWLKAWLPIVQRGADYKAGRLAIIVTFDEDDSHGNNTVLTTVVSPYTSHVVSSRALTHYSLTRYLTDLTGDTPLRAGATAASMRADFRI